MPGLAQISNSLRYLGMAVALVFSQIAIAAEPTLRNTAVVEAGVKISKAIFLYQEKTLEVQDPVVKDVSRPRRGFLGDVAFPAFGDLLVADAARSLTDAGVNTIHSGFMPEGKSTAYVEQLGDMLGPEQMLGCSYIIVTPAAAQTTGSVNVTVADVVFSVRVNSCAGGKVIWRGMLHTQTRAVKTAMARMFERKAELYDEAYAQSIFRLLVAAWRRDGLL